MRRSLLLSTFSSLLLTLPAQAWWENGHRTTARLAASYLTPQARTRIASILGVADTPEAVADGLAVASTWPDEIKKDRPETANWHFIDLALQDTKSRIAARCPEQNCVTARIDEFSARLIKDKTQPDAAADLEALRFLVHFVGDVHQPLHDSSDADQGGNCEPLSPPYGQAKNLHAVWDGPFVDNLNPDDRMLAANLRQELDGMGEGRVKKMGDGNTADWAWEAHKIAVKVIYKRLGVPKEDVVFPASCKVAPADIVNDKIEITTDYANSMKSVVRLQLERGGLRLARLLNAL